MIFVQGNEWMDETEPRALGLAGVGEPQEASKSMKRKSPSDTLVKAHISLRHYP
jgi:hypothetical protein